VLITGVSRRKHAHDGMAHRLRCAIEIAKAMAARSRTRPRARLIPAQYAAATARVRNGRQDVKPHGGRVRKRSDIVVSRFRPDMPGVEFVDPLGAFTSFFRVDSVRQDNGDGFLHRIITQSGSRWYPRRVSG